MLSRDDFKAARMAAIGCANASFRMINVVRMPIPDRKRAEWLAHHLGGPAWAGSTDD